VEVAQIFKYQAHDASNNPSHILTHRTDGIVVFAGFFLKDEKFPAVSIKRLPSSKRGVWEKEIQLLRTCIHPNIVKYVHQFSDNYFLYIIAEYCKWNLTNFVRERRALVIDKNGKPTTLAHRLMQQMAEAVYFLHKKSIAHKNIKPENILVDSNKCIKICDLSCQITMDMGDLYLAPEILQHPRLKKNILQASDIFSLGIVYHEMLASKHPFLGMRVNIDNGGYEIDDTLIRNIPIAAHLIRGMIQGVPTERPMAQELLQHPCFWESSKQKTFFQNLIHRIFKKNQVDDQFYSIAPFTKEMHIRALSRDGTFNETGINWLQHLHPDHWNALKSEYDSSSAISLVRAIHDTYEHLGSFQAYLNYLQLSQKTLMEDIEERFPYLFLTWYDWLKNLQKKAHKLTQLTDELLVAGTDLDN